MDAHLDQGADNPPHWNYWAREGLAYRHRVVAVYEAGGIDVPTSSSSAWPSRRSSTTG